MLETILLTLLIYVVVRTFLFENYQVVGQSMMPTLQDGQYLVVSKLDYRLHEPQRGDVIVFLDPRSSDRKLIKRIIGLPGEMVQIRNGAVFVNEQRLNEPYIKNPALYNQPPTPVPAEHYYVLGDNRSNSSDSHNWGTLDGEMIVGKAWLSYWPPEVWGMLAHADYSNLAEQSQATP
ncbi:MAG: signal peptidase I [Anaerolineae bacterium]|jgi:signal peptidase I